VAKHSSQIGPKGAQTLYYATVEQANRIGLPLNVFVTVNFACTTISPEAAVPAFQKLLHNHYAKWISRPRKNAGTKAPPTYAYVFENCRDDEVFDQIGPGLDHNVHVHALFHVPPGRFHDFSQLMVQWLDAVADDICAANAVKIAHNIFATGLREYMLKGQSARTVGRYSKSHKPQGLIIGKRSGVSQNLGPTARIRLDKALGLDRRARLPRRA